MFFWVLDGLEALRWTTFNFIWLALKSSASMDKFLDKESTFIWELPARQIRLHC